jgi:hypothetical protein
MNGSACIFVYCPCFAVCLTKSQRKQGLASLPRLGPLHAACSIEVHGRLWTTGTMGAQKNVEVTLPQTVTEGGDGYQLPFHFSLNRN